MKSAVNAGTGPPRGATAQFLIGVALAASVAMNTGCARQQAMPPLPAVLVAESAVAGYSLRAMTGQESGWRVVYVAADTANLTLVEGTVGARGAQVERREVIDRVDVAPGVNPVLGSLVAFQSAGQLHIVYADQELPDQRVAKWIHRSVDAQEPWRVELLAPAFVPLAVLAAANGDVVVYGVDLGEAEPTAATAELEGQVLVRGGVAVETAVAARLRPPLPVAAGGSGLPTADYYQCTSGTGFVLAVEGSLRRIQSDGVATDLGKQPAGAFDVACAANELIILSAQPDRRLEGTDSSELVLTAGERQQLVTVARAVTAVALLPQRPGDVEPGPGAGARSNGLDRMPVLFTERLLQAGRSPQDQLALIAPAAAGEPHTKRVLATRAGRILDFAAMRIGASVVIVLRSVAGNESLPDSPPNYRLELLSLTGI